ncbi:hypothetical protein [Clostridium sp. UBA6640]|uniref:hypothetical protein n=1 Tax=Clostridium sp. UBA6640 TaxID=1946370 RepID=UPI0025BFE234|nr:hypothetical protein [Clostridium sp. UBA6640]
MNNVINVFEQEFKNTRWGGTLNNVVESLQNNRTENIKISKFDKAFSKNRDMKLVEYDDELGSFKLNIKYYFDKEFDTFYYSREHDLQKLHKSLIDKIRDNTELSDEEITQKYEELINKDDFKSEEIEISKAKENRQIIKFGDYRLTLGLYFFCKEDRNSIETILKSFYGESEIIDGHSVWKNCGIRMELAPNILTYVPIVEMLKENIEKDKQ